MQYIIDTRLNNFKLPVHINQDCDYYHNLEDILDKYHNHICEVNIDKQTKDIVAANIQIIKSAIQRYFTGDIGGAKTLIQLIIKNYISEPYFVSKFDKSYAFRGLAPLKMLQKRFGYDVRYQERYKKMNKVPISLFRGRVISQEECQCEVCKKETMLHIPFDLRKKVSTQRYSMPGIPCLYLSTTTLSCDLELGKPSHDSLYLSSYKFDDTKMKLLNLCIIQNTINGASGYIHDYEIAHLLHLIEIFPLVIAASFVVDEDEPRSFKTEYIIPQLIMLSINEMDIDAVAYLSVHMPDEYSYPYGVNIAIPMRNSSPHAKYSELMKKISFTEPIRFDKCLNYNYTDESYINKIYRENDYKPKLYINQKLYTYFDTDYSKIDNVLVSQHHSVMKCDD